MHKLGVYISEEILRGSNHKIINFFRILFKLGNQNATLLIRIFQIASKKNGLLNWFISGVVRNRLIKVYGIELSKRTEIGLGLKIGHANGIIIGEGVKIGENVTIYHQVTLGISGVKDKGNYESYPRVGDDCIIYAGAKVLGNIHIGKGTVIGANSVVLCDTEENSVYAGIPAKRIK